MLNQWGPVGETRQATGTSGSLCVLAIGGSASLASSLACHAALAFVASISTVVSGSGPRSTWCRGSLSALAIGGCASLVSPLAIGGCASLASLASTSGVAKTMPKWTLLFPLLAIPWKKKPMGMAMSIVFPGIRPPGGAPGACG